MITSNKALEVFLELTWSARVNTSCGSPDEVRVRCALRDGKPIPDDCLPGRMVMELSSDKREALQQLRASDIQFRSDAIYY